MKFKNIITNEECNFDLFHCYLFAYKTTILRFNFNENIQLDNFLNRSFYESLVEFNFLNSEDWKDSELTINEFFNIFISSIGENILSIEDEYHYVGNNMFNHIKETNEILSLFNPLRTY